MSTPPLTAAEAGQLHALVTDALLDGNLRPQAAEQRDRLTRAKALAHQAEQAARSRTAAVARVRDLAERVAAEVNDFGTASAGWVWWQEIAEELAEAAVTLAELVVPAESTAGTFHCPSCTWTGDSGYCPTHRCRTEHAAEADQADEVCEQCGTETEGLTDVQGSPLCPACIAYNVSRCM